MESLSSKHCPGADIIFRAVSSLRCTGAAWQQGNWLVHAQEKACLTPCMEKTGLMRLLRVDWEPSASAPTPSDCLCSCEACAASKPATAAWLRYQHLSGGNGH